MYIYIYVAITRGHIVFMIAYILGVLKQPVGSALKIIRVHIAGLEMRFLITKV